MTDMASPILEWLPDVGPFTATGTWSDESAYLQSCTITMGRQYEIDRFSAGTATLTLVSADRRWDPEYTSGTYYGKLLPMRQWRIRMEDPSATEYDVFRGYVTDWGQTVPGADNLMYTTITLRDAFAVLETMSLPGSWLELAISKDQPTHWWHLDEASGTVALDSGYGTTLYDGVYVDSPSLSAATVVTYDGGRQGVTLNGTSEYVQAAVSSGSAFTVEAWFIYPGSPPSVQATLFAAGEIQNSVSLAWTEDFWLGIDSSGYAKFVAYSATGSVSLAGAVDLTDGNPHQIAVTDDNTTLRLYVDGAQVNSTTYAVGVAPNLPNAMCRIGRNTNSANDWYWAGTIANVAVWAGTTLSATQILAHYNAGTTAHSGDDTGTHIARVLAYKGFPSSLVSYDTGSSEVGAYELPSGSVLEFVQRMADTEAGQTYVAPNGVITHRARSALWSDTRSKTSQATFGDEHSAATLKYVAEGFEIARDEALLRNPVSASRSGGVTVTAADTTLITTYGERSWSAPVSYDSSDNVVRDRANYLLSRFKELGTRLVSMAIKPRKDSTNLWPQVGNRRIGDRITVKRTPLGTGNEIELVQIIEGVSHTFSPMEWTTTYRGSPADTTIYFTLDDNDYGELDDDPLGY